MRWYKEGAQRIIAYIESTLSGQHKIKSLATFLEIVEFLVRGSEMTRDIRTWDLAEESFQCSFETMIQSSHGAAVKLLLAEIVQEFCSKCLSEKLMQVESAKSEEAKLHSHVKNAYETKTNGQKKRACRKKALKQRRRSLMCKAQHEERFRAVLTQLVSSSKQREYAKIAVCIDLVHEIINGAFGPAREAVRPQRDVSTRNQRRRKQRAKKGIESKVVAHIVSGHMDYIDSCQEVARNEHPDNSSGLLSDRRPDSDPLLELESIQEEKQEESLICSLLLQNSGLMIAEGHNGAEYEDPNMDSVEIPPFRQHVAQKTRTSDFEFSLASSGAFRLPTSSFDPIGHNRDEVKFNAGTLGTQSYDHWSAEKWYQPVSLNTSSNVAISPASENSVVSNHDWDFKTWQSHTLHKPMDASIEMMQSCSALRRKYPFKRFAPASSSFVTDDSMQCDCSHQFFSCCEKVSDRTRLSMKHATMKRDIGANTDITWSNGLNSTGGDDLVSNGDHHSSSVDIKERSFCSACQNECTETLQKQNEDFLGATSGLVHSIAKLEECLESKTKSFEEIATGLVGEISDLRIAVKSLEARLCATDESLRLSAQGGGQSNKKYITSTTKLMDAQRFAQSCAISNEVQAPDFVEPFVHCETLGMKTVLGCDITADDGFLVNSTLQADNVPVTLPPQANMYGSFVSVPMSTLPPRSRLHWDMCEFVTLLQAQSNGRKSAQTAAQRLCTTTVQSLWPRAQVRAYGSFVTQLALPSSDLDLVICLPKVRHDAPAEAAGVLEGRNAIKETWQQNLARKLRREPWVVPESVKTIPHAAMPIITLLTKAPYNVRLDISFEGPGHNGLATNDVVHAFIHEFPSVVPLMLVLKSFVIERGYAFAYSGGLSSYALLLMVVRYLQDRLNKSTRGYETYNGTTHMTTTRLVEDLGITFLGFLDFYGNHFDPRLTGISVASRCFLNRDTSVTESKDTSSAAGQQVPDKFSGSTVKSRFDDLGTCDTPRRSLKQIEREPLAISFSSASSSHTFECRHSLQDWPTREHGAEQMYDPHKFDPIFLEDPLQPSNNVGRNCFRITQIRRSFSAAHEILVCASLPDSTSIDHKTDMVAGVVLHPQNILRSILGSQTSIRITSPREPISIPAGPLGRIQVPELHSSARATETNNAYVYSQLRVQPHLLPERSGSLVSTSPSILSSATSYMQREKSDNGPHFTRRHSQSNTNKGFQAVSKYAHKTNRKKRASTMRIECCVVSHRNQLIFSPGTPKSEGDSRKASMRSLSFADVVIGNKERNDVSGKLKYLSNEKVNRGWRDDIALSENRNGRLKVKDDWQLP
uniref:Uncharacterized protein AlNc14C68G4765 n=1 Tax=Albugo laibachii Nc14 TaxID=890382 RepID=F0WDP5_9STRA|nr:conserved hypothetical protein [Albugo laibachii Nc14]|eukprot:CCA19321.1 conserved hypothetical protein [Albugo laibachii Nc14]